MKQLGQKQLVMVYREDNHFFLIYFAPLRLGVKKK